MSEYFSKIAVVIPFKDRAELLIETISSLKQQSFDQWTALLVDDGSNSDSLAIIRESINSDPRFVIQKRVGALSGPSICRNQGALNVNSELLMFLDSDDLLMPGSLARRVEVMARNADVDFCIFSSKAFCNSSDETSAWTVDWNGASDLDRLINREWPLNVSSLVWRTAYFNTAGRFDETLPSWEDWELHVRVLAGNPKYLRFSEADVLIRTSQTHSRVSSTQYKNSIHLEAAACLFPRIAELLHSRNLLSSVRSSAICELIFGNAYLSLMVDGPRNALVRHENGSQLFVHDPSFKRNRIRLVWCIAKYYAGLVR